MQWKYAFFYLFALFIEHSLGYLVHESPRPRCMRATRHPLLIIVCLFTFAWRRNTCLKHLYNCIRVIFMLQYNEIMLSFIFSHFLTFTEHLPRSAREIPRNVGSLSEWGGTTSLGELVQRGQNISVCGVCSLTGTSLTGTWVYPLLLNVFFHPLLCLLCSFH